MLKETVSDVRERMAASGARREPYTAQQVADAYGFSVGHIYDQLRAKLFVAPKVGRSYEIKAVHILEWRKRKVVC